jgi:hypothetical protein
MKYVGSRFGPIWISSCARVLSAIRWRPRRTRIRRAVGSTDDGG